MHRIPPKNGYFYLTHLPNTLYTERSKKQKHPGDIMKKLALSILLSIAYTSASQYKALHNNAIIFSASGNIPLAQRVADYLHVALGQAKIEPFNDGEVHIKILENVRNKDVFIIQPTCSSSTRSVNDNLMELFLLIRTMKRSSAATITVVMPYYGYARQDRKAQPRVPISAADVAYMLEQAGATRVLTIDLHCGQIQGFFQNIPVDNLYASPTFASYMASKNLKNVVVVSPDAGGVERATQFVKDLGKKGVCAEMAVISKQRAKAGVVSSMHLIGDVKDADAIIIDDMCDTGGTLIKAAELLREHGACRVFAVITHPVFSGKALENIGNSVIEEMIVTDTIPLKGMAPKNITVLSVAELLGHAIACIKEGESVSALFN